MEERESRERNSTFFLRSKEIESWVFITARVKSVHGMRATRGYQNRGVLSNSNR